MPSLPLASRRQPRPPLLLGLLVAFGCLVAETAAGALLQRIVPFESLGVLYLIGLVLITFIWGLVPGALMAVASTIAFDYFLIPPAWSLNLARYEDLASLAIFMAIALLVCALVRLARLLSVQVEAREEADLCAELARLLLRTPELGVAMPLAARRLARALGLPSASIRPDTVRASEEQLVFPLHGEGVHGSLVVPARTARPALRRLRDRVVPSLEVLLEAAHERERVAGALRASRDQLARIVEEQAALRRLATLVAHAAPPTEVFQAVAREAGCVLGVLHTMVARFEPDGSAVCVGSWDNQSDQGVSSFPVATRWAQEPGTLTEIVWRTRAPGRVDRYESGGTLSSALRERGIASGVGCPIVVGRSLWGLLILASSTSDPLPEDTERRMMEFTELTAAAIANAQSAADLRASRARVVAAADEARRRIERELHDGTQQRLVSLGLELRGIAARIPADRDDLRRELAGTAKAIDETVADLQEQSRGLHPAALAKGGLEPGLLVLTRRCGLPVELEMRLPCRLAQQVELAAYHVVAEGLANATRHASASLVHVGLTVREERVRVSVRDNGCGGADPSRGSGLLGLTDRVEALGGTLSVISPAGGGTSLSAELPFVRAE